MNTQTNPSMPHPGWPSEDPEAASESVAVGELSGQDRDLIDQYPADTPLRWINWTQQRHCYRPDPNVPYPECFHTLCGARIPRADVPNTREAAYAGADFQRATCESCHHDAVVIRCRRPPARRT